MTPSWPGAIGDAFKYLDVEPFSPLAFAVLPLPLLFLRRRGKSAGYLLCFSLFFLYLWSVSTFTIFKFAPGSATLDFTDEVHWSGCINLIPKLFSSDFDPHSNQVYGNFLLGVPFGVGLPFVARATQRQVVLAGLGFAAGIELAQLLLGLLVFRCPYRIIDIDDVLLVFAGALLGHGLLLAAARVYRRIAWAGAGRLPLLDHIHAVLLGLASAPVAPVEHGKGVTGPRRRRAEASNPGQQESS